jgi:LmbE family N-acetylglucosaminyl deacetylase
MPQAGQAHDLMRTWPAAELSEILGGATPIVLAPHQDDEVLGCGAMIAAAAAAGFRPRIIFTTDGAGSHPNSRDFAPPVLAQTRKHEAICAAAILGVDLNDIHFLDLADTKAPHEGTEFDAAVARVADLIMDVGPMVIFAPWSADPHCDHLATHLMATALAASSGARHLSYPVWGWTLAPHDEIPEMPVTGWRFPVSPFQQQRQAALAAHRSQVSSLITDDPTGFRLDPATLQKMWSDHEAFMANP